MEERQSNAHLNNGNQTLNCCEEILPCFTFINPSFIFRITDAAQHGWDNFLRTVCEHKVIQVILGILGKRSYKEDFLSFLVLPLNNVYP